RLLVHAADKAAAQPLKELLKSSERPKVRLQALCTLDALGLLSAEVAVAKLKDSHPAIREHAIQFCEAFLTHDLKSDAHGLTDGQATQLLRMVDDPDPRVRQQLAFTSGEWDDARAAQALLRLGADPRLQIAVMSSAPRHVSQMLAGLFAGAENSAPDTS